MSTQPKSEDKFVTIETSEEEQRRKEGKAKLVILIIIGILTAAYGSWNVYRMVVAVRSPVVTMRTSIRQNIPAADDDHTKGASCNQHLTNFSMDATSFVNMRGYDELEKLNCYIFNPYQKLNGSYGDNALYFDNSTQKVALALWANENANNTLGAITQERWFFFGIFAERDDPTKVKFQIVKMPSISYVYFRRIERYDVVRSDAITGGGSVASELKPDAKVEFDTTFSSFSLPGFIISPNLWEIIRIIPSNYVLNPEFNKQEYPVTIYYNRVEFTLLQLAANMGGFVSILSAAYFILFGSRRVNPWGLVQRHILKNVPAPPPVYVPTVKPYSEKTQDLEKGPMEFQSQPEDQNNDIYQPATSRPYVHELDLPVQNVSRHQVTGDHYTPMQHMQQNTTESISPIYPVYPIGPQGSQIPPPPISPRGLTVLEQDMDDPRIQRIRHELKAEVQITIAREFAKLRLFLSKYYLKDVIKSE
ncbi:2396_t:CDS:10 [Funneliformis geosporum]|uniref:17899_t:CDS:1 n=1 Tax=Funneliformis geosporum TaxID=1117311 RepID=A0A9W4SH63_9GLOM|nr:2396_t:CDS:10 [Funneliformis geosporum]CAI2169316.1 17899_t:CDS:10 [Funneliformis geosporum]